MDATCSARHILRRVQIMTLPIINVCATKGNNCITNYRNSGSQQWHRDGSIEREPRWVTVATSDVLWHWYVAVRNLSTHPIYRSSSIYLSLSWQVLCFAFVWTCPVWRSRVVHMLAARSAVPNYTTISLARRSGVESRTPANKFELSCWPKSWLHSSVSGMLVRIPIEYLKFQTAEYFCSSTRVCKFELCIVWRVPVSGGNVWTGIKKLYSC
jgi:hypothetical protein